MDRVLTTSAARAYYDRFGEKQDRQGFYEDPAIDELIARARFPEADNVFEFGCGTGKCAARLLAEQLPGTANYLGCDISPVMIDLARQRLAPYGKRARAVLSKGGVEFPLEDHATDRVIANYVLDLLSADDIGRFLEEAHRVLVPGGYACLASLTRGVTRLSRIVSSAWSGIFRLKPSLVGGCRPLLLDSFVDPQGWKTVHRHVVTPFCVPSEVLVLAKR